MLNITRYQRNANQNHKEVPFHASQNGCYPSLWRKGNPLTLWVGMQTSIATMENSVGFLKKLEIELPYDPAIPLLGIHIEETRIERDTCSPMFITAVYNSQDMEAT